MKRSVFAKIATLALALVLVLSLAACGKKSDSGVKILVPNDTTNEARALLLLQENGIITLKDGVLVAAIARGSEIIIPSGTSIIQEGDHVVVVTNAHTFDDLGDILA